jgi:hypothetical protein
MAAKGRGFIPPVRLDIGDAEVDGHPVVVARVHECDQSLKPCRLATTGKAYLRGYDGDYLLSALEEQAFLSARSAPMADRQPVDDATPEDLDPTWSRRSSPASAALTRKDAGGSPTAANCCAAAEYCTLTGSRPWQAYSPSASTPSSGFPGS